MSLIPYHVQGQITVQGATSHGALTAAIMGTELGIENLFGWRLHLYLQQALNEPDCSANTRVGGNV